MMIIGITGTLGAGKGTVVEYLEKQGFVHYSARAFIVREIEKRGMPIDRDSMHVVADDLRATHSPSYILEELYKEAERNGGAAVVLESIHSVGEAVAMRQKPGFHLLAVDADPKVRYERIVRRGSATDAISFEKFLADEDREMHSTDPNQQNIGRCVALADYKLVNNGTVDELYAQVEQVLRTIQVGNSAAPKNPPAGI